MQPVAVSDADILENSEGRDDRNCGGEKMDPCMTDCQDRVAPEDLGPAPMCDDLTGEVALRVDRTRVCVVQEEGPSGIEECDTIMGEAFSDGGGEEENPLVSANIMSTDDVQRPDPGPSQLCDITGHKRGREDWIKECSMAESSQPQSEVGSKWLESVPLECEISTGKVGCNIQDVGTLRLIGPESSAAPPVPVFVYDCDRPLPWSSKARVMKFCFVCLTSKSGLWFSNPRCCQSICDGCTLGLVRKGVNVHDGGAECSVRFPGMGGKRFYNMLRKVLGEKLRVRKASGDAERWKSRKQVAGRLLSCSLSPSDIGPDGLPIWRSIELTHGESEKSDSQEDADQNDIVDGETNQHQSVNLNLNQDGCGGENEIDVVMEDPRSERSLELPSDDKEELASGVEEMPILHVTATTIADGNATRSAPPPALESVPAGRLEDFGEIPGFIDEENVLKVGKNVEGGPGAQPHVGVSIGITVPRDTYFADIPRLPCPMMQGGRGIGPVKEKKLNAAQTRHLHQSRRLKAIRKMVAQGMPHSTAAQHCQMMSSSGPVESTRCVGAGGNENGAGVSQPPQPTLPDVMAMSAVSVPVELPSLASLDVPVSLPPFVLDIVTKHCGLTVEGKGTSSGSAPQKPISLEYRRAMCPVLGPSVTARFTDARIRTRRTEDLKKVDMHFTPYGLMNMTIEPPLPSLELKKIVKGRSGCGDAGNQPPFVPNLTSLPAARAMIRASGPLSGSEGNVGQFANKGFQLLSNSRCLWCKKYLDPCKANAPSLNSARLCEACSAAPGCPSRQRHHSQIISIDGAGENQHAIPSADLGVIDLLSDGEPSPPEAPQIEVETEDPPPQTPENPESEEEKEKEKEAVAQPNLNEKELDKLMPLLQALETAVGEPRKKRLPWWMALYDKFETNGFIPRSKRSPRLVHRIGWLERDGPRVKQGRVIENERVSAFISNPTDPLDHYKSMYRRKRLRLNSQTFTKGREKNSARGGKLVRKKRRPRRGGRLDSGESGSIPWAHLFKKSPLQDCNGGGVENRGKAGRMPDVVSIDFNEESGSVAAERIQIVCQNCGVLRMVSDVESFVRLPSKVRSRCRDCRKDMEISSPRRARKLDRCCRQMEKGIRRWWQDLGALPRDASEDEVLSEILSSTSEEPELRSDGSVGDFLSPFRLSRLPVNRDDPTPGIVSVAFGLLPPFGVGSRKRAMSMKEANRDACLEGQCAGGSSSGVRLDRSCSLKEGENLNLQGENREEIGGAMVEYRGDLGADSGGPDEPMGKTRPVAAKPLLSIDHDLDACEEGLLTLDGDCGMDLVEKTDGDYLYPWKGSRAWKAAFNIVRGWSESHTQAKLTRYGLSGLMCGLMKKTFIQSEDL